MTRQDAVALAGVCGFLLPFFTSDVVYTGFVSLTAEHGYIMSGLKFAILATFGEVLGQRLKTGSWSIHEFGLLPKMIVWYVLGVVIKAGFVVFAAGDPAVLRQFVANPHPILTAFSISLGLNLIFAPVFMTMHKITDLHIADYKGSMVSLTKPIDFARKFSQIDWKVQYGFVFKKTIPFFWIPAHTITFILPSTFQVLFAASLGVALGAILALAGGTGGKGASSKGNPEDNAAESLIARIFHKLPRISSRTLSL